MGKEKLGGWRNTFNVITLGTAQKSTKKKEEILPEVRLEKAPGSLLRYPQVNCVIKPGVHLEEGDKMHTI